MTIRLEHNAVSASPMARLWLLQASAKLISFAFCSLMPIQPTLKFSWPSCRRRGLPSKASAMARRLLHSLDFGVEADDHHACLQSAQPAGLDLLLQLRLHGVNLPVVFSPMRSLPAHESLAFDHGAIDLSTRRAGVEVLVRRSEARGRSGQPAADSHAETVSFAAS